MTKTVLVPGAGWPQAGEPIRKQRYKSVKGKSKATDMRFEKWMSKQSPAPVASITYLSIIEELEAENRMLRARNDRLIATLHTLADIIEKNLR
jgi:hypothetical protein